MGANVTLHLYLGRLDLTYGSCFNWKLRIYQGIEATGGIIDIILYL